MVHFVSFSGIMFEWERCKNEERLANVMGEFVIKTIESHSCL